MVPLYVPVVVPARVAYSHSASVGRRYPGQAYGSAKASLGWQTTSGPSPSQV